MRDAPVTGTHFRISACDMVTSFISSVTWNHTSYCKVNRLGSVNSFPCCRSVRWYYSIILWLVHCRV